MRINKLKSILNISKEELPEMPTISPCFSERFIPLCKITVKLE